MHVRCEMAPLLHYSRDIINCPNSFLGTKYTIIRYLHVSHNTPCFLLGYYIVVSKQCLCFVREGDGGKQGVLREMCKWRILNNRFTLFSLNCQKLHSSTSFLVTFHVIFIAFYPPIKKKRNALAGNRTRASRVAGENSTTEPPVPCWWLSNSA